ncbi:hypothetical protein E2C01_037128 [Portunus trituberculatus]|uniref:Uncharacterized protein n=1 Tax=Portunus trituberculatus TaxID=210409 RepID=A0A5B7FE52_PORTR|nr:hypothetical protein [Portunus trituberculatus]
MTGSFVKWLVSEHEQLHAHHIPIRSSGTLFLSQTGVVLSASLALLASPDKSVRLAESEQFSLVSESLVLEAERLSVSADELWDLSSVEENMHAGRIFLWWWTSQGCSL